MQTNILGTNLEVCCTSPITGFYRGTHTVCVILTKEFLEYSKAQGNDLTTAAPQYGFPGLKPGDKWCLCALRWIEAYDANCAPKIIAEATSNVTTNFINKEVLLEYKI